MKATVLSAILAIVIAGICYAAYAGNWFSDSARRQDAAAPQAAGADAGAAGRLAASPARAQYDIANISFKYPAEMTAGSFEGEDGSVTALVQDASRQHGVQIAITPVGENGSLTVGRVRRDLPDISMSDVQEVDAAKGSTGLYFASDYPSFGGPSKNIWFFYKGDLYQLSSSPADDPLLRSVFASIILK